MAQGAVFRLVLRDERFDRAFTASDLLRARVKRAAARGPLPGPEFLARTHALHVRSTYRPFVAVATEYTRVQPAGASAGVLGPGGGSVTFDWPTYGHFTSDMVLHLRLGAVGDPAAAAAGAAPTPAAPLYRWCAYPGLRAPRRVELRSEGTLIDDYTSDDAAAWAKSFVSADARAGWARCLGQQEPKRASYFANGYTGYLLYGDGPQTPRLYQPPLELFVPLQFWFCRDASQALPNDLLPNTQRTITVDLAPLADLLSAYLPANGGLEPTSLPLAAVAYEASLYVGNLYVNPEVHDLFAARASFTLARVHRRQTTPLEAASGRVLLDRLRYAAEFLLVGVRDRALLADPDAWWLMGAPAARPESSALLVPAMVWNPVVDQCQLVCRTGADVDSLARSAARIGVVAHGIPLYPELPATFYGSYLPTRYATGAPPGERAAPLVAPVDANALLVPFCLYPGAHGPSGYYNASAGRELYVTYALEDALAAGLADGLAAPELVVSASTLNFLVRRGDRLALRYSL